MVINEAACQKAHYSEKRTGRKPVWQDSGVTERESSLGKRHIKSISLTVHLSKHYVLRTCKKITLDVKQLRLHARFCMSASI